MNNKDYGLDITNDEVELFQKFLGYGDPFKHKIWFLGNEEAFNNKKGENPESKIINNELNIRESDLPIDSISFFTKKFSKTYSNGCDWDGYVNIKNDYNVHNLDDVFIGEVYFLPTEGYSVHFLNNIFNVYGGRKLVVKVGENGNEYYSRKEFYEENGLKTLLEDRLSFLSDILSTDSIDIKKIYFYGDKGYKISLLEKYFGKPKGGNDQTWIFNNHEINLIEFISYNKNDSKVNEKFSLNDWIYYDKCNICCSDRKQKINNDNYIIECTNFNCENNYES